MTSPDRQLYRALRATIRERGTARVWILVVGAGVWASLAAASVALATPPIATLVPLVMLAATFEAIYALHVGVERVGRFLSVHFDDEWERAAAAFGRPAGAATANPLFSGLFTVAAIVNLLPLMVTQPTPQELIFVGGAHALFGVRLMFARLTASKQRAIDNDRFQKLREDFATKARNHENQTGT